MGAEEQTGHVSSSVQSMLKAREADHVAAAKFTIGSAGGQRIKNSYIAIACMRSHASPGPARCDDPAPVYSICFQVDV